MKILIFIIMFVLIGCFLIISNNNLYIYKTEGMQKFAENWSKWKNNVQKNLMSIISQTTKLNWMPK